MKFFFTLRFPTILIDFSEGMEINYLETRSPVRLVSEILDYFPLKIDLEAPSCEPMSNFSLS